MKLLGRLTLSLIPLGVTLGGWKIAIIANSVLGCEAIGKHPQSCLVGSYDLMPVLSFFSWWGMLLWIPGLVVSGLLVGKIAAGRFPRPWGSRPKESSHER